jgi:excisionase family DNA binding protein
VEANTHLPLLLTVDEVAAILRTTRAAVYAMVERRTLPGVTRRGRAIRVFSADLIEFLHQNRESSLHGSKR